MSIIRIGIAGYMGAGKSTCIHLLSKENTVLIDADSQAKWLMENDQSIKNALFMQFGDDIKVNDAVDFKKLGKVAFSSLVQLQKLNKIVHPPLVTHLNSLIIKEDYENKIEQIILDAALIPLWHVENWFDYLLWIESPHEIRLDRLVKKYLGKIEIDELEQRMKLQEALFAPPDIDNWTVVRNCGKLDDLNYDFKQLKLL
jgi:dephospho-CoA kinase